MPRTGRNCSLATRRRGTRDAATRENRDGAVVDLWKTHGCGGGAEKGRVAQEVLDRSKWTFYILLPEI